MPWIVSKIQRGECGFRNAMKERIFKTPRWQISRQAQIDKKAKKEKKNKKDKRDKKSKKEKMEKKEKKGEKEKKEKKDEKIKEKHDNDYYLPLTLNRFG